MKTFFQRPDRIEEPLYVVTTVFNSPRYKTRWKLYEDFASMVKSAEAILYTVEVAFGDREFVLPRDPKHPERLLQLRTKHELWLKENALNLLVSWMTAHVPCWEYVAWLDADIRFVRADWDDEIKHALQHFAILQPWSQSLDLDSRYEINADPKFRSLQQSVGWAAKEGLPIRPSAYYYGGEGAGKFYHPGYAWATRRGIWDGLGGLLDTAILGSADNYMAQALLGQVQTIIPGGVSDRYRELILEWQQRAEAVVRRNVGATDGLLLHHYHGAKASRRYRDRNQILIDTKFNPDTDIKRDAQGLWQLGHRNDKRSHQLRDQVREYFHGRNEDMPSA